MWAKVLIGVLGLGAIAAAAAGKRDDEDEYPPPPPDVGTAPTQPPLILKGQKVLKVYGTKTKPKLKNVPATVVVDLPAAICNGAEKVTVVPYTVASELDVHPSKIHASWGLFQWCMAYASDGALGALPAGVYVVITSQAGGVLSFGPYKSYELAAEGIRVATKNAFESAKGWSIK